MKKTHIIVLDGVGLGKKDKGDAFYHAQKPYIDSLFQQYPWTTLKTYGESVGLPEFQTGGSEVGHITIGAGRPIKHLLTKINDQIDSGEFFENEKLKTLFEKAQQKGRIHFMGLLSDGGIHSFQPHLYGLLKMAKSYDIPHIYIHAFLDGRDVGERTAKEYLQEFQDQNIGTLASLGGRFFGMDRDNNWERVQKAYEVISKSSVAAQTVDWETYINDYYANSTDSDYYVPPALFEKEGQIQSDDVVVNFDFRTDRMRQISNALCNDSFADFETPVHIDPENYGVFGNYYEGAQVLFSMGKESIKNTLGELVSKAGGKQLRITETEKFNHVTFFFSGERKEEFEGEKRILIPSPKCASYAEKPEMSAAEQTEALIEAIEQEDFQLIVQNYANGDLVGHSGDFEAAVKAVETVDACLAKSIPILLEKGYDIIILADHGNCDQMYYENGEECASHTKNPVPCLLVSPKAQGKTLKKNGTLADIAPTALNFLDMPMPSEMTGTSLFDA